MSQIVFTPIQLGPVTVQNRIVRTAHATGMAAPYFTDSAIEYHVARAKGGCGLSILGAASVHPSSILDQAVFHDDCIPGLSKLAAKVRPHGMKLFQQLWHGGNLYATGGVATFSVSSSASYTGVVGQPMTTEQVEELIQAFAAAAVRCRDSGLDGVEIHAAHGYVFDQFLSPLTNDRIDKYGGPFENRIRPLLETLRAVRAAVGPNFCVGVRLAASEAPGGADEDSGQRVLHLLQEEGLIDYVNGSFGDYYRPNSFFATMDKPLGYALPSSGRIIAARRVPGIVGGRFRTLEEVEQVLRDGTADLVSMVRAHIADPDLIRKTREGRAETVRPCIACNQGCVGGLARGRIGCTVNAVVGSEAEFGDGLIPVVKSPKKVLIVGGGPAGLEAARVAASAGHQVILAEAAASLGGTVNIAKRAPKLHTLGDITSWLEQEVYRLGVEVRLSTYMDAQDVRLCGADAVILATGSIARMDGVQNTNPGEPALGVDQAHVISSADVFVSRRELGVHALVLDCVGHYEALAVTEQLLTKGLSVAFVTGHASVAPNIQSALRDTPALERFYRLGTFTPFTRHHLVEIQRDACVIRPLQGERASGYSVRADTVVLVTHNEPLRSMYDELRGEIPMLYLIGDARSPRDLQVAIADGYRAARQIF
ncbi:MAG TPA: FAD-dependent oxidoreductase [Steroidobacteraceae bacterium]|jgi:2,4-dienoyl-CoA reductase-like NADH-dependent reductase (Old Yellow Enzyme family)